MTTPNRAELPLFAYAGRAPSQSHSPTSQAAGRSIEDQLGRLQRQVLSFIVCCGPHGATDEEIQDRLQMPANTERPRRRELQLGGWISDSGSKRKTRSARSAVVWRKA